MGTRPTEIVRVIVVAASIVSVALAPSSTTAATKYRNCAALNQDYPNGLAHPDIKIPGRPGWVWQRVKGRKVALRPSKISKAIYNVNTARDGDKDKVACEQP